MRRFTGVRPFRSLLHTYDNAVTFVVPQCDQSAVFAQIRLLIRRPSCLMIAVLQLTSGENDPAESFHSRLPDEILALEEFEGMPAARRPTRVWKDTYTDDTVRWHIAPLRSCRHVESLYPIGLHPMPAAFLSSPRLLMISGTEIGGILLAGRNLIHIEPGFNSQIDHSQKLSTAAIQLISRKSAPFQLSRDRLDITV